jgi:hypothetical protein
MVGLTKGGRCHRPAKNIIYSINIQLLIDFIAAKPESWRVFCNSHVETKHSHNTISNQEIPT